MYFFCVGLYIEEAIPEVDDLTTPINVIINDDLLLDDKPILITEEGKTITIPTSGFENISSTGEVTVHSRTGINLKVNGMIKAKTLIFDIKK